MSKKIENWKFGDDCIFLGPYCDTLDLFECNAPAFLCKSLLNVGCGYDNDKIHKCSKLLRLEKWIRKVME